MFKRSHLYKCEQSVTSDTFLESLLSQINSHFQNQKKQRGITVDIPYVEDIVMLFHHENQSKLDSPIKKSHIHKFLGFTHLHLHLLAMFPLMNLHHRKKNLASREDTCQSFRAKSWVGKRGKKFRMQMEETQGNQRSQKEILKNQNIVTRH